ncbi:MAG: hypothetical protein DME56_03355, partial [Verrucomicrobia bacterium]
FEKIVAQIVMYPADFSGAAESLLVRYKRGEKCPDIGKSKCETLLESGTNGAVTHLIQRVAVPPAIHVGLAEPKRPGSKDSVKEAVVMHLYVPGASAVNANVGESEQIGHHILCSGHMIRSVAEALRRYLMNRARSAGQSRDPLAESPGRSVAGVDKARRNKRARDRPPLIASG